MIGLIPDIRKSGYNRVTQTTDRLALAAFVIQILYAYSTKTFRFMMSSSSFIFDDVLASE